MAMPQTRHTVALDDPLVWQELTRVARAALRDGASDGEVAQAIRTRVSAGEGLPRSYEVRAQPLLHASDERRTVIVIAVDGSAAAAARPLPQPQPQPEPEVEPHDEEASAETIVASADELPEPAAIAERFGLSPRQAEVAVLLALRLSTKEIASRLGISRHTARTHVEGALLRLGVHRRTEVAGALLDEDRRRVARLA